MKKAIFISILILIITSAIMAGTLPTPVLSSPGLGATNVQRPVSFDWYDVSGATVYRIQIATSPSGWTNSVGFQSQYIVYNDITSVSFFNWNGAQEGQTYYWSVRAGNSIDGSYYATYRYFTTAYDPLAAPTLLAPSNYAVNVQRPISFDWGSVSGATIYRIQVATSPSGWNDVDGFQSQYVLLSNTTSGSYYNNWSGASAGQTLYWSVRGGNPNTGGFYASYRRFTTASACSTPSITSVSPSYVAAGSGGGSIYIYGSNFSGCESGYPIAFIGKLNVLSGYKGTLISSSQIRYDYTGVVDIAVTDNRYTDVIVKNSTNTAYQKVRSDLFQVIKVDNVLPNSGNYNKGGQIVINWTCNASPSEYMKISIKRDSYQGDTLGTSYQVLNSGTSNDGSEPFPLPTDIDSGSDWRIWVAHNNSNAVAMASSTINIETALPTVTLTNPNSGSFQVGETINIQWNSTSQHHFGLYLEKGEAQVGTIIIDNPSVSQSYNWTIPSSIQDDGGNIYVIETGSDYKIALAIWNENGVSVGDKSDNQLTIDSLSNCSFVDLLNDHWGYEAITYLCNNGIVHGDDGTNSIRPDEQINRAELAKAAFLGGEIPDIASNFPNPFNDLQELKPETLWYYSYAKNLCYLEYRDGISPFTRSFFNFYPANPIERRYVLKVLLETFDIKPDSSSVPFGDVFQNTPEDIAMYPYICKAYELGIIYYDPSTHPNFRPTDYASRAEAFQMLYKTIQLVENGQIPTPLPQESDFYFPDNLTVENLSVQRGMETGNFEHYSKSSFFIPGRNVSLNFVHAYNSYSTELPAMILPIRPLGVGWTHSYNSFIIKTQASYDTVNNVMGKPALVVVWPDTSINIYDNTTPNEPKVETKGVYDQIVQVSSTEYTITKKNQVVFTFQVIGNDPDLFVLTSIADRHNNTIEIGYEIGVESVPRIKDVTDPVNRKLTFFYHDGTDLLKQVTDPLNRSVFFNFSDDKLTTYSNARSHNTIYSYGTSVEEKYLLKTLQLPKGNVISNTYEQRRLVSTQFNNTAPKTINITTNYSNPQAGDFVKSNVVVPNSNNQNVTYYSEFNKNANLTHLSGPPGVDVVVQYNDAENSTLPTDITDRGVDYHVDYDNNGNPTQLNKTDGSTTIYEFFYYNTENDIVRRTDPVGSSTIFTYTSGNLTSIKDPLNNETTISYNAFGQVAGIVLPSNISINYGYNSYGNRDSTSLPALGINSSLSYDSGSRITSNTDFGQKTIVYNYDNNNNITKVKDPLNFETIFTFDNNDNLTAVTNAKNRMTTLDYYFDTDLLKRISFEGNSRDYSYNDDGSLHTFKTPNNHIFSYNYDSSGRITGDGFATYSYDTLGNLKTISRNGNTITFTYDGFNRVSSISYNDFPGNTVSYQYDKSDNVTRITYPGGKDVVYTYNANNQMKTVTDWNNQVTTYNYRTDSKLAQIIYPNDVVTNYAYDNGGRMVGLTNIRNNGAGEIISQYNFSLDNAGNHIQESINEPYNSPGFPDQNINYTYDNGNRIITAGTTSFGFDSNGNTVAKTGYSFAYDEQDNLTGIIGEHSASYTYDGAGHRRSSTRNGIVTRYVLGLLGMSRVLMETDTNGVPNNYYVYGLGLISRIKPDNTTHYYHYDFRGSTIAVTDDSAIVTHSYAYGPFGNITDISENDYNPFRYVGKYGVMYESDALYFMRARYYDPKIGRFLSEDPIWNVNLYPYAGNSPIMSIDPLGLELKVCSNDAFVDGSPFNHAYLYSTKLSRGEEMSASFGKRGFDFGGNILTDTCNIVNNPHNVPEEVVLDSMAEIKNQGLWFPFLNDCHTKVDKALTKHHLHNPTAPGGRSKIDESIKYRFTKAKERFVNALLGIGEWIKWRLSRKSILIYSKLR